MSIIGKVECQLCKKQFRSITHSHVTKSHGISLTEYVKMFPDFPLHEENLPENKQEKDLLLEG